MLFNSVDYILLLLCSLVPFWLLKSVNLRLIILFIASAAFYISWSFPFYLMLIGVLAVYFVTVNHQFFRTSKAGLICLVVGSLILLAYFKYASFFVTNFNYILTAISPEKSAIKGSLSFSIILPLGISFYVFQLIAYAVDVFTGKCEPERNPLKFFVFITFFPQLIAGPICRSHELLPQLSELKKLNYNTILDGFFMILAGFFLKTAIADGVSVFVNIIYIEPKLYSGFDNFCAILGFGIQILCDFWGYSLMALGSAKLFNIELPHNFNLPYLALNITDFWRRWHITLSHWLRDYLYIPLGGNRAGKLNTERNLLITMLLGGLWHGASWNFVAWGAIHGLALIVHKYYAFIPIVKGFRFIMQYKVFSWLLTQTLVFIAWIFFRADTFDIALQQILQLIVVTDTWFESKLTLKYWELVVLFIPLHFMIHRMCVANAPSSYSTFRLVLSMSFLALLSTIYYVDGTDFIYFQF